MLFFPFDEIGAATAKHRLIALDCEKCNARFFYILTRIGSGLSYAPFGLDRKTARLEAQAAADSDVEQRLKSEGELVPCPYCHWINKDLVERHRKTIFANPIETMAAALFIGFMAFGLAVQALTFLLGKDSAITVWTLRLLFGLVVASPIVALLVGWHFRRRFNPNVHFPMRPKIPIGSPRPLVAQKDEQTGETFVGALGAAVDEKNDGTKPWAVYPSAVFQFPPFCCICMGHATTKYKAPFNLPLTSPIDAPLCDGCARHASNRRAWIASITAVIVAAICAGIAIAYTPPDGNKAASSFAISLLGLLLAAIGLMAASGLCQPYEYQMVDGRRSIARFAATNPEYTKLVIREVQQNQRIFIEPEFYEHCKTRRQPFPSDTPHEHQI